MLLPWLYSTVTGSVCTHLNKKNLPAACMRDVCLHPEPLNFAKMDMFVCSITFIKKGTGYWIRDVEKSHMHTDCEQRAQGENRYE